MKLIGSYPNTRLRRNRKTDWSRRLVRENTLSANDLIWPIFLTDGKNQKNQISTMPGVYRYSVDKLEKIVEEAHKLKLPLLDLFPHNKKKNKEKKGSEALKEKNLVEVADALTDLLYVTYGAGHAFGIDLDKCFKEVQRANMSKLGEDGEPIYNDKDKVMKGPNYSEPNLKQFIE